MNGEDLLKSQNVTVKRRQSARPSIRASRDSDDDDTWVSRDSDDDEVHVSTPIDRSIGISCNHLATRLLNNATISRQLIFRDKY
jgi:hypothetical protein